MKKIITGILFVILCFVNTSYANLTNNEIVELNNATPGTFKAKLGTVLAAEQASIDVNTSNVSTNSTNITTAQNTADTALGRIDNVTLKFLTTNDTSICTITSLAYVRKYVGTGNEGMTLGAGDTLQILTFALAVGGGGQFSITPDTSSGFDQINFTAAGDNATLRYVGSSIGWTLIGLGTSDTGKVVAPIAPFN